MEEKNNLKSGTAIGMADTFKKATSEMLMLYLLQERPMYVYEMIQELERRSESGYTVGTLYLAVSRLQKFQYIAEHEKRISAENRLRKYYCITKTGIAYYQELRAQYDLLLGAVDKIFHSKKREMGIIQD